MFACLALFADCKDVVPSCKYRLGGTVSDVTGPLPCNNGLTWSFIAASMPTLDGQVACNVPGDASLVSTFSEVTKACNRSVSSLNVLTAPTGNKCSTQLNLGTYTGKCQCKVVARKRQGSRQGRQNILVCLHVRYCVLFPSQACGQP